MSIKKSVLGRGINALLEDAHDDGKLVVGRTSFISIDSVIANPYQPRTEFDEESLQELAASIKSIGIIQPITVRMIDEGRFQLISGERRLRASRIAGLESIPAYVRLADDQGMLEMALVENLQREDLDPIEVALSFVRLLDECNLTQEELSDRVGKKRSTISNFIRLLKLPPEIQSGLRNKEITMGHARALISIEDPEMQTMVYNQAVRYDFSVRKVEEVVRELSEKPKETIPQAPKKRLETPEEFIQLKAHLTKYFKTDIEFKMNHHGKGKIVIPFSSEEDLERIVGIFDDLSK